MKNLFALAAVALFATACGPNCDSTAMEDKYTECGIDMPDMAEVTDEVECTQELADQVACTNDCTKDADCAAFDATAEGYLDAITAWGACVADCTAASTDAAE